MTVSMTSLDSANRTDTPTPNDDMTSTTTTTTSSTTTTTTTNNNTSSSSDSTASIIVTTTVPSLPDLHCSPQSSSNLTIDHDATNDASSLSVVNAVKSEVIDEEITNSAIEVDDKTTKNDSDDKENNSTTTTTNTTSVSKSIVTSNDHGDDEITEEEVDEEEAADKSKETLAEDKTSSLIGVDKPISDNECQVSDDSSANQTNNNNKRARHVADGVADCTFSPGDVDNEGSSNNSETDCPSELSKKTKLSCENNLPTTATTTATTPTTENVDETNEKSVNSSSHQQHVNEPTGANMMISSEDVAEMARFRAAKFIQERTKMACILNSSSSAEQLSEQQQHHHQSQSKLNNSMSLSVQHHSQGSSRKRKLTVKDILVSQRNRENSGKQSRVSTLHEQATIGNNNSNSNNTAAAAAAAAALGHMFPGLAPMLEQQQQQQALPSQTSTLNEAATNPFAAISAAIAAATAAAAAANSSCTGEMINANGGAAAAANSSLINDSQSYISTLASTLSTQNAAAAASNPVAALALMASLGAMMQNNSTRSGTSPSNKEMSNVEHASTSNSLVNFESTLANVMANDFGQHSANQSNLLVANHHHQQQLQKQHLHRNKKHIQACDENDADDDDDDNEADDADDDDDNDESANTNRRGAPLDFSIKNFTKDEKSSSRRKIRKKLNGTAERGGDSGEIPLDLSLSTKPRSVGDESSPIKAPNQENNPLAAMFPHLPNMMDGGNATNSSNMAAMAAAAAAAAAAASSFPPNLLTKMAASMAAPWSASGGAFNIPTGLKIPPSGNDSTAAATAAAFNALLQQMNNGNHNNNGGVNAMHSSVSSSGMKSGGSSVPLSPPSVSSLFQSFPDLAYWNGGNKQHSSSSSPSKASTPSPSFGVLSNSSASSQPHHLASRHPSHQLNSSGSGNNHHHHLHHHQPPPAASQPMRTKSSSGRQNPWQAQWINRSSEQTRDVFTCVWCKESFKSLAEMTDHMKRSPRCGMAGMQQHHSHHHGNGATTNAGHQSTSSSLVTISGQAATTATTSSASTTHTSSSNSAVTAAATKLLNPQTNISSLKDHAMSHGIDHMRISFGAGQSGGGGGGNNSSMINPNNNNSNNNSGNSSSNSGNNSNKPSGVNMPRKLVRGQDVWLGRGAEQTRQILKCMWCGQSFKSLADMTQHMKITQHYTNIISQEQITSWRTPEEKMAQSQVNAVLTCKVCDEAFSSLKELSNHMIKNSHFKENATRDGSGRSTPTSLGVPAVTSGQVANRTAVDKRPNAGNSGVAAPAATSSDRRKKSLPVRKLLELERGEFGKKSGDDEDPATEDPASAKSPKSSSSSQLIECDDCHDKIEPRCFLQHIKQCRLRGNAPKSDSESEKSKADSEKVTDEQTTCSNNFDNESNKGDNESKNDDDAPHCNDIGKGLRKPSADGGSSGEPDSASSGSVLSALEKLIEKNFDSKSRRSQQTGILQRLGIDEEVFPPWQNMAPSPLSAMSPSMAAAAAAAAAAWNSTTNGLEQFSRSSNSSSHSSSSNHSVRMSCAGAPPNLERATIPQLRYRRNSSTSSSSLKDKFMHGLHNTSSSMNHKAITDASNGSFSSQETEEEESCDESIDSDSGVRGNRGRGKRTNATTFNRLPKSSRLNFPISSMLSSPIPARPTSASSTASSSISPSSDPLTTGDQSLHRMTPNSHRSAADDEEEDEDLACDNDIDDNEIEDGENRGRPLALCKKLETNEKVKNNKHRSKCKDKVNGSEQQQREGEGNRPAHNPLLQLQKLLDKTDHHNSSRNKNVMQQHQQAQSRMSPFSGSSWHNVSSLKAMSPASSPQTPPIHSPSSVSSAKSSEDAPSSPCLTLKCAFCDTQIASRTAYRAHLAKTHLLMRDSVDLSGVSDEELLLLVLAKNSNLPLMSTSGGNSVMSNAAAVTASSRISSSTTSSSRSKGGEGKRASKLSKSANPSNEWEKSSPNAANSPSPSQMETSQSKFLKYAELAKQLSSKYV